MNFHENQQYIRLHSLKRQWRGYTPVDKAEIEIKNYQMAVEQLQLSLNAAQRDLAVVREANESWKTAYYKLEDELKIATSRLADQHLG